MTIERIFKRIPWLKDRFEQIISAAPNPDVAYVRCKAEAEEYVGFHVEDEELGTVKAHMCVVNYIADRLAI